MKTFYYALVMTFILTGCDEPGHGTATGNSEDSSTIRDGSSTSQTQSVDTAGSKQPALFKSDSDYTNKSDTPGYPTKKK